MSEKVENLEIDKLLHQFLDKCAVCGVPCTSSCGACKKVAYCSKAHQQQHWKSTHKSSCFPLILKTSSTLGRYLVTTRDVRQGEIILKEAPIFSGPHLGSDCSIGIHHPVCLSCFRLVQTDFTCSKCGWPLCGIVCEKDKQHSTLECKIFAELEITPDTFFEQSTPDQCNIYEGITVLRGVLQKQSNPSNWSKIMQLQSHKEERNEMERARKLRYSVIHFVRQVCGQSQCQEEEIDHVLGAIGVNAFVSDDGVSQAMLYRNGTYLYHIASMPAHNCTPNSSWLIQLNSDFHLRAAISIKSGESVNFLYTEATQGTYERRKKLLENKYFLCGCDRCCDPSELGTFFSGVKCPDKNCSKGFILPGGSKTGKETETDLLEWSCDSCKVKSSPDFVKSVIAQVDQELFLVDQEDSFASVEKLLKISKKYSGITLHSNHSKIHDIDNDVLQRISFLLAQQSQSRNNGNKKTKKQTPGIETKWAKHLVELSRKCLAISDIIWPGFNRHRGRLLYFLQQGLLIILFETSFPSDSKPKSKTQPNDLAQLKKELQEILEIRREVLQIFQVEPEGREECYIAKGMLIDTTELQQLKSFLQ